MPGLVDAFAGQLTTDTVEVLGRKVDVTGISARGIATLLARFPEIAKQMRGGGIDFLGVEGDVMAAFIAAGTGALGDKQAEEVAASLPLAAQVQLLTAVMKRTNPTESIGPLAQGGEGAPVEGDQFDTVRAAKSGKRSRSLSPQDKTNGSSGVLHPDN